MVSKPLSPVHVFVSDNFTALGEAFAWPIQGLIRHFRPQLEARVRDYKSNVGAEALAGGWEPDSSKKGLLIAPGQ